MESRKTKSLQDLVESVQPLSYDEQGKLLGGFTDASIDGIGTDVEKKNGICSSNGKCSGNGYCLNNEKCSDNSLCVQPTGGGDGGDDDGKDPIKPNPCG